MEKDISEIIGGVGVGSTVIVSKEEGFIFLQTGVSRDCPLLLDAIERLEKNGYTLVHGVQHATTSDSPNFSKHYYSAQITDKP